MAVRRTYGPILTTGVALTAAAVVVANPIAVAPRSDVRIPSVSLSAGTDDAIGMLDPKFLDAIAPGPPQSGNPFSVLKQLITSLAADATSFGKSAIVDAFVAGIAAVSEPELTASTDSFVSPLIGTANLATPEVAMSVLPGIDVATIIPEFSNTLPDLTGLTEVTSEVTGSVASAVKTVVKSLINDAGYVGGQVVAAAFAVGAVVAAEPGLIGDTLVALVNGDFKGALQSVVKIVAAPFGPPIIIFNAVATVLQNHLDGLAPGLATPTRDAAPSDSGTTDPSVNPDSGEPANPRGTAPTLPVVDVAGADAPAPAAAAVALDARIEAPTTAAEADATLSATPRAAVRGMRDALAAVGDQIGAAATATADTVGQVASRARGGKPGPAAAGS